MYNKYVNDIKIMYNTYNKDIKIISKHNILILSRFWRQNYKIHKIHREETKTAGNKKGRHYILCFSTCFDVFNFLFFG